VKPVFEVSYRPRGVTASIREKLTATITFHDDSNEQGFVRVPLRSNTDRVYLRMSTPARQAWFLNSKRRFERLSGTQTLPFPLGQFFVMEGESGLFRVAAAASVPLKLTLRGGNVTASLRVYDRLACGFSIWGEHRYDSPGTPIEVPINIMRIQSLDECVWLEPFPDGVPAALCITDHPDFEDSAKLELIADLFCRNDIRFTKAVFPYVDDRSPYPAPGMNDVRYSALVRRLYEHGSEIALHSLDAAFGEPSPEERSRRLRQMAHYRPRTWIDHSIARYLLSRGTHFSDGTPLVGILDQFGIENYWSYNDIIHNPFADLSCWPRVPPSLYSNVTSLPKLRLTPKNWGYMGLHHLKQRLGSNAYSALYRHLGSPADRTDFVRSVRVASRVRSTAFYLYDFTGVPMAYSTQRRLLFDTVVLNHAAAQLRPGAVDGLVASSGLCIAHTYFGFVRSYGFENCFDQRSPQPAVLETFRQAIEHISYLQSRKQLVTLPVTELRRALSAFWRARIIKTPDGFIVTMHDISAPLCVAATQSAVTEHIGGAGATIRDGIIYRSLAGMTSTHLSTKKDRP
jgi:hypothetical protein